METLTYFEFFSCPADDQIFTDVAQFNYDDETVISGYKWSELRELLWTDPYFNKVMFFERLSYTEHFKFQKLADAQDEIGWTNKIIATQSEMQNQIDGFSSLGFESAY